MGGDGEMDEFKHNLAGPAASDPDTAAELWLACIAGGSCTPQMREEFERWRRRPEHAAAYTRAERLWSDIGALAGNDALRRIADEAMRTTAPERRRRRNIGWALAATLATLAAIPAAWHLLAPGSAEATLATLPGQRSDYTLPDGSRVSLNVDTLISYRFDDAQRRISLLRGEALFAVAHDADRPFRVAVGNGQVEALGTRFQVRKHAGQVDVTLLEGSVEIEHGQVTRPTRIRPGTQATYWLAPQDRRLALRHVDIEVVSSWTRGRLLFRGSPLSELIAETNRYAATPIHLADPTLRSMPISGTFPLGDNRSVALALQAALPLQADFSDAGQIVLDSRN